MTDALVDVAGKAVPVVAFFVVCAVLGHLRRLYALRVAAARLRAQEAPLDPWTISLYDPQGIYPGARQTTYSNAELPTTADEANAMRLMARRLVAPSSAAEFARLPPTVQQETYDAEKRLLWRALYPDLFRPFDWTVDDPDLGDPA